MLARTLRSLTFTSALLALTVLASDLVAQDGNSNRRRRGRGLWGDWVVQVPYGDRKVDTILSFGRNSEGKRTAQWISFFEARDITDLSFENGEVKFSYERTNRQGEKITTKVAAKLADGKLTGTITRGDEEREVSGERRPWTPRAVGTWNIAFKLGEREIKNQLVVAKGEGDSLEVDWKSTRAKHEITDVKYSRGQLSFKSDVTIDENTFAITFEGSLRSGDLQGKIKSERSEVEVSGKRANAAAIGTWAIEVAPGENSDRPPRKQRLRIDSDLSGLYGTLPISDVKLDGDKLTFKAVIKWGDNEFEFQFAGKIDGESLSGEITSQRGSRKVTGKKAQRWRGRRGRGNSRPDPRPEEKKSDETI